MSTISHGLEGIVLTETRLSRIDGERGELLIGGFPLEELAPNASFEEVLHLLWHDRLPDPTELRELREELATQRALPAATLELLRRYAERGLDPMDALRSGVATLDLAEPSPHFARGSNGSARAADRALAAALCARIPTLVASYWRLLHGEEPSDPPRELGHAAAFLTMLTGSEPDRELARALDAYLCTVVDHGMNASTFTARVISSTRSDMISATVGAVGALKGPAHGGAPGPALDMVFEIRARAAAQQVSLEAAAEDWVRDQFAAGERIMGFGHRVYRVRDPRADVLAAVAERMFARGADPALHRDALAVEQVVLRLLDEHKPERALRTNVEFYTALVLHGVGLETALFTPTFAIARVGGWTAHILEQTAENRLIRPRVAYRGPEDRRWIPSEARA